MFNNCYIILIIQSELFNFMLYVSFVLFSSQFYLSLILTNSQITGPFVWMLEVEPRTLERRRRSRAANKLTREIHRTTYIVCHQERPLLVTESFTICYIRFGRS